MCRGLPRRYKALLCARSSHLLLSKDSLGATVCSCGTSLHSCKVANSWIHRAPGPHWLLCTLAFFYPSRHGPMSSVPVLRSLAWLLLRNQSVMIMPPFHGRQCLDAPWPPTHCIYQLLCILMMKLFSCILCFAGFPPHFPAGYCHWLCLTR
jgi:hypothetical protein